MDGVYEVPGTLGRVRPLGELVESRCIHAQLQEAGLGFRCLLQEAQNTICAWDLVPLLEQGPQRSNGGLTAAGVRGLCRIKQLLGSPQVLKCVGPRQL